MSTHIVLVFAGWSMASGGDTRRRVRAALEFLRHEPRHRGQWYVVCLGGRFNRATVQKPAATFMREWMVSERLLPAAQIFAETRSRDTFENLAEAFALLEREGINHAQAELIVVSHPWHEERIQSILTHVYHRSARMIPAWHYLDWKERLTEIGLRLYGHFDRRGQSFLFRWIRARRTQKHVAR
jgi:uncharacterized SAM-binding protein YcdF (DUF218 family)